MIATTFNSLPVFLISFAPDWQRRISVSFEKLNTRSVGNTAREDREELGDALRTSLSYETLLNATEAAACRALLQAWDNRPILCPFWPAETLAADHAAPAVQGALRVWWEPGWTAYSINTGTAPTHPSPTAACRTAPLLYGKFEGFPLRTIVSGKDDETVTISIVDNGPAAYALTPKTVSISNGASVNGQTVPLLTVPFTWGGNQSTVEVRQKMERVGFGREAADTFYTQAPRTKDTLRFAALTTSEVAEMLGIFHERGATVKPLWIQAPQSLQTSDRSYGRFYSDRLSLTWAKPHLGTGEVADAEVEFLSLPTEKTVPPGETFGTSIGPHEKRWFGYLVTCGASTWRFTSREADIAGPGGTFEARQITHGTITEEINLAVNDCTLTVFAWPDCPFSILTTKLNAEPMMVTIYEGTVAAAASAAPIYTGMAMAPKRVGLKLTIKLRGPSALLGIKGPRPLIQETCRAVLGDSRCRVNIVSHTLATTITSFTGGVATTSTAGGTYAAGYFRNGYIERTVSGLVQRIAISDSYDDGTLKLLLANTPTPAPTAGESWAVVPGCDGYFDTCHTRFNNRANFRGFERLPRTNPTMVPIKMKEKGKKE